jgi:hypothetical protein
MGLLHVCPHGEPARAALWQTIDAVKGPDALTPVTVAVPSPYAGLTLRRGLAARPDRGGLVNVRFLPLARVAELLGAPALAESCPLTAPVRAEAVRAALGTDPGAFAGVAGHAATVRSLESTFRDLRRLPRREVAALAGRPEPAASVALLYEAFRTRTAPFYDEEDLAVAAADAVAPLPAERIGRLRQRHRDRERRAAVASVTVGDDRAPLRVHERLADGQPEPEPAEVARDLAASLLERVEQARVQLRVNADAVVLDLDRDVIVVDIDPHSDVSRITGIFDRVVEQIQQRL